jgi:hemerythrin-like domain-containing protein
MMDLFEPAPTFNDPLGMLRACHRRIERALTVMERVAAAEASGALDAPTQEALRQTLHYFRTGVPRHAKDEEESLFPRMRRALGDRAPAAAALLDTLQEEHVAADTIHQELEALGEGLLDAGRFAASRDRARFSELIDSLRQLYQQHIRHEDNELFPLAALVVDEPGRDAIGAERAARRGIDWEQQQHVVAQLQSRPWMHGSSSNNI